jgi:hypothetical protein
MLLMPIGVSTVLEFSGAAAVLISPGRVSEVLCCESIPLVITLLSQSAGQAPALPSKVLRNRLVGASALGGGLGSFQRKIASLFACLLGYDTI